MEGLVRKQDYISYKFANKERTVFPAMSREFVSERITSIFSPEA